VHAINRSGVMEGHLLIGNVIEITPVEWWLIRSLVVLDSTVLAVTVTSANVISRNNVREVV